MEISRDVYWDTSSTHTDLPKSEESFRNLAKLETRRCTAWTIVVYLLHLVAHLDPVPSMARRGQSGDCHLHGYPATLFCVEPKERWHQMRAWSRWGWSRCWSRRATCLPAQLMGCRPRLVSRHRRSYWSGIAKRSVNRMVCKVLGCILLQAASWVTGSIQGQVIITIRTSYGQLQGETSSATKEPMFPGLVWPNSFLLRYKHKWPQQWNSNTQYFQ